MKLLLTLFLAWSGSNSNAESQPPAITNQNSCASVWVMKAYKTCAHPAHGVDINAQPVDSTVVLEKLETDWDRGKNGDEQIAACNALRDKKNQEFLNAAIAAMKQSGPQPKGAVYYKADPTVKYPLGDGKHKRIWEKDPLKDQWSYTCPFRGTMQPFKTRASKNCGVQAEQEIVDGRDPSAVAQMQRRPAKLWITPNIS